MIINEGKRDAGSIGFARRDRQKSRPLSKNPKPMSRANGILSRPFLLVLYHHPEGDLTAGGPLCVAGGEPEGRGLHHRDCRRIREATCWFELLMTSHGPLTPFQWETVASVAAPRVETDASEHVTGHVRSGVDTSDHRPL
jgi:hypothetical protein